VIIQNIELSLIYYVNSIYPIGILLMAAGHMLLLVTLATLGKSQNSLSNKYSM